MKRYILPRAGLLALAVLFSLCASGVNATSACPTADVVACPWIAEYACP